jgi:hypothetical protein
MAVIAASCFLLLCNLAPTLVLWSAVVEEVFSRVIGGHKKAATQLGHGINSKH